jgi:ABC-type multidrug transport system permease subunit
VGFCGLLLFTIAIPHYTRLRAVFYREAHLYSRGIYGAALALAELPWLVLYAILFTVIFTPMARFNMNPGPFFTYFAGALLTMGGFLYAGIAASAMLPSAIIAQIAGGAFLAVIWLFAYVFVPWGYLPAWWRWFSLIDFAAHAVRAITTSQFHCDNSDPSSCPQISVPTSMGPIQVPTYTYMSQLVGATYEDRGAELGYSALIVFGIMLGAAAAHYINWQRR